MEYWIPLSSIRMIPGGGHGSCHQFKFISNGEGPLDGKAICLQSDNETYSIQGKGSAFSLRIDCIL
jgi:hypothetical protein